MVLRKITIDISVRCIPQTDQIREKIIKTKSMKTGSLPHIQSNNNSQNNKKNSLKMWRLEDLLPS